MIRQLGIVLVLGCCALGLTGAGCGGGGSEGPALTLEQYFAQLQEIDNLASSRIDRIGDQLDATRPEGDEVQALRDAFPEQVATLRDLVESMERLRPPAEVREAHDAAVAALKNSVEVTEKDSDAIQEATTLGEVGDLLGDQETADANQRTNETCLALEAAGTSRGITVDLDC